MRGCAGKLLGASAECQPWTAKDDAAVRALYLKGGVKAVRRALPHRTVSAIMHRARRFGLKTHRRWTTQDDIELRSLWYSGLRLAAIARRIDRTPAAVYVRAQHVLKLPLGVPEDCEYLSHAATRTGYETTQLWQICEWAGVEIRRCLARPTNPRGRDVNRFHYVDPLDVDDAVKLWLRAEWVNTAAKARGLNGETLTKWLHKSGHKKKAGYRMRWRVASTVIDAVVEQGRAGKFARWPSQRTSMGRASAFGLGGTI